MKMTKSKSTVAVAAAVGMLSLSSALRTEAQPSLAIMGNLNHSGQYNSDQTSYSLELNIRDVPPSPFVPISGAHTTATVKGVANVKGFVYSISLTKDEDGNISLSYPTKGTNSELTTIAWPCNQTDVVAIGAMVHPGFVTIAAKNYSTGVVFTNSFPADDNVSYFLGKNHPNNTIGVSSWSAVTSFSEAKPEIVSAAEKTPIAPIEPRIDYGSERRATVVQTPQPVNLTDGGQVETVPPSGSNTGYENQQQRQYNASQPHAALARKRLR